MKGPSVLVFYSKNISTFCLSSLMSSSSIIFFASRRVNSDLPVILEDKELAEIFSSLAIRTCVYPAVFIASFNFSELITAHPFSAAAVRRFLLLIFQKDTLIHISETHVL